SGGEPARLRPVGADARRPRHGGAVLGRRLRPAHRRSQRHGRASDRFRYRRPPRASAPRPPDRPAGRIGLAERAGGLDPKPARRPALLGARLGAPFHRRSGPGAVFLWRRDRLKGKHLMQSNRGPMTRTAASLLIVALLAGCSTLPRDGPSGRNVVQGASSPERAGDYALVDLDFVLSERLKAAPPPSFSTLALASSEAPTDVIGVGDTLAVSIFEPGGALFGGGSSNTGSSGNQTLPPLTVNRNGA